MDLCVICVLVKKVKKKKLILLKIFFNEILKVKYKGRRNDSGYYGKGFKFSDGCNMGDNGFFFKILVICKNNKLYK